MRIRSRAVLMGFILVISFSAGWSQNLISDHARVVKVIDSLAFKGLIYNADREKPDINFSKDNALLFLQSRYNRSNWKDPDDPLRKAMGQLIFFVSNNPVDSTISFFEKYSYDSLAIPWEKFFLWDTLKVKIPSSQSPLITQPVDSMVNADTALVVTDSLKWEVIKIIPKADIPEYALKDTLLFVVADTISELGSLAKGFPFIHYNHPFESDSIKAAIYSLINFIGERDSMIVKLAGIAGDATPVWLNSKSDKLVRFWLRNEFSDSVSVWMGTVSNNTLGIFLEDGIMFRRPVKQSNYSDARLNLKTINSQSLQEVNRVFVKPQYWKFRSEASFILNQSALSNWVKGGENSISTAMDITGFANYDNKKLKLSSNNFIRLKYGLVASGNTGIRKNLDLFETSSKINHKAFGKFEFSGTMLFKTQIAKGYKYPNDSVPVSKFLNPAILTIGLGLDYKPNKNTSLNFAPLSYKSTYVTDTAHIDQTKYGIPRNRRSLHEPGLSFLLNHEYKPLKNLTITNRFQLFTNYIHNPFNIDIDWEMIAAAKINWFTEVRFNTHLIFDDDTKTLIKGSDGNLRKTARIQFKEILGFSFIFRF